MIIIMAADADDYLLPLDRYSKVIKDFVDDAVTLTSQSDAISSSSFDSATCAVMDRFNLHDALVRIPMTHGELGANSNVGYTDSLCSRKMNKIPMSDFFAAPLEERERQIKQRQYAASASLWMNESIFTSGGSVQERDAVTEQECVSPEARIYDSEVKEEIRDGMSVFDLKFIAATIGLFLFMNVASRKW
jgi:hypothetical protein